MTTETLPTALDFNAVEAGNKLAQETAVLEIHISQPGFRKRINTAHFMKVLEQLNEDEIAQLAPETKAMIDQFKASKIAPAPDGNMLGEKPDADMIHVSQDLLDRKALKIISKHDHSFTQWIKRNAIASPIKFQGAYLMRLSMVDEIDARVEAYTLKRKELVNALGERWDAIIEDAKKRRGPFFDSADYPLFGSVRVLYSSEFRWLSFNVPAALERLNSNIYQRESEKAKVFFADVAQEARDAARVAFQGLTEHLMSQLGNDESGKQKRFMGSSVAKLKEFTEMFLGGGDLTGDSDLNKVVRMAKDILSNVDAKDVRSNEGLKSALTTAVKTLQGEASKLIVVGQRKFAIEAYEDEPEAAALSLD